MRKNKKIGFTILASIAAILLVLFLLGIWATQRIESAIDKDLSHLLTYENIDVSILKQEIEIKNPEISIARNSILAERISVEEFNIYQYLVNNKIRIGNIAVRNPEIILKSGEEDTTNTSQEFEEDILIKTLTISEGTLRMVENDTTEDIFTMSLDKLTVSNISLNAESVQNNIPFDHESYQLEVDSLQMKMDDRHNFTTGKWVGDNGNFSIDSIRIIPKYDKIEFQKHIPYELDRIELMIENVSLNEVQWGFQNDSLKLESSLVSIEGADLEIYRNKLIRDDPRLKALYSATIRKAPFKLHIPKVEVKNSKIVYQEKMNESRPPGEVQFYDVNAEIENITNIGLGQDDFPTTIVDANALFMNETRLQVDWEFDSSSEWDEFQISGRFGSISANAINSFVRPAMNVEARGGIESLAFNYAGNDDNAYGEVRIEYEDFKIDILKGDGTEKRSFWSSLANLFISNDAVNDDVRNEDLEVTRDKNKSFWNFLWLMVREGALASFL